MLTILDRNYLFVKTKKTASTSIEILLSELSGDKDIVTPLTKVDEVKRFSLTGKKPTNYCHIFDIRFRNKILHKIIKQFNEKHYNHQPYTEILNRNAELRSAIPFSIVRHPLTQAKSNILWLMKSRDLCAKTATDVFLSDSFIGNSQIIDGMPEGSSFFKYENLQADLIDFCKKQNIIIDASKMPYTKVSQSKEVIKLTDAQIMHIKMREDRILKFYE